MNRTIAQPSTSHAQITALEAELKPADADAVGEIVAGLTDFGFVFPDTIRPGREAMAYRMALAGEPLSALKTVARKLIRGSLADQSTVFLPKPAELAKLVREEAAHARFMRRETKKQLAAKAEAKRLNTPMSDEERERRRKAVARWQAIRRQATDALSADGGAAGEGKRHD